jgi:hypothetical protein
MSLQLLLCNAAATAAAAAGSTDGDGNTSLHLAARAGDVRGLAALLADGADVNVRNSRRQTPLHMAAEAGMVAAVERLVQVRPGIALLALGCAGLFALGMLHTSCACSNWQWQ